MLLELSSRPIYLLARKWTQDIELDDKQNPTAAQVKRPRARRFDFVASIEVVDLESEVRLQERLTDLSLYGCGIAAAKPFPAGTRVQLGITYNGARFAAIGRVAYAKSGEMGIAFVRIDKDDQLVLERWIAEFRARPERYR